MSSLPYIGGFMCGIFVGLYYFYGLLFTVRRVPASPNPKRLLAISYLLRLSPVLMLLVIFARKDPGVFITLLIGFFMVRFIMTRKITGMTKEKVHASQS